MVADMLHAGYEIPTIVCKNFISTSPCRFLYFVYSFWQG